MGSPDVICLSSDDQLTLVPPQNKVEEESSQVNNILTAEDLARFQKEFTGLKNTFDETESMILTRKNPLNFYLIPVPANMFRNTPDHASSSGIVEYKHLEANKYINKICSIHQISTSLSDYGLSLSFVTCRAPTDHERSYWAPPSNEKLCYGAWNREHMLGRCSPSILSF